jgi:hypothetical protein
VTTTDALTIDLARQVSGRYFGKYRGIVDKVGEGDRLGYIRARVPDIYGTIELSPWATPCVPAAGPSSGFLVLPRKDDLVWIELEGGSPSSPIWTGFCWASGETPPDSGPRTHVFASPDGHRLLLDDAGGRILIERVKGPSILIESGSITLTVGTKSIVLDDKGVKINGSSLEVT